MIKKYWYLLAGDPILYKYVSKHPSGTCRKSKLLRDMLVSSH